MDTIKVVIVDDHPGVIELLQNCIDFHADIEIIGTASNGLEATLLAECKPDIMLMDCQMPLLNGKEATKQIKRANPEISILMITAEANGDDVMEAIAYGASGFLLKEWGSEKIILAVKEAMQNRVIIPSHATASISKLFKQSQLNWDKLLNSPSLLEKFPIPLTEREMEIAFLLLKKYSNSKIAAELYLSLGTVKNYLTSLYKKLGVCTRKEAVQFLESLFELKTVV
ncbi:DNA-binding NarL/FixJ family response regulator [Salirhabdus euzebyi]|uniref:DNA-binding NarL/FixJ family response regulator n=1 Tax=Salirhabdus euzebyi TaxID=394506 RepID=A0A841PY01_9BACI|nr:response regulator transcription factor [Salirhabdus euzebyi]MBB6451701.1 DNA-binding NarL/FixJ family response regulator [Salirhabdus euzebyi]